MKKGDRRKANKRHNRFIVPKGIKSKRKHNNPLWLNPPDAKALRDMVNQTIGMTLLQSLKIDFVGIMEREAKRAEREGNKPGVIQ